MRGLCPQEHPEETRRNRVPGFGGGNAHRLLVERFSVEKQAIDKVALLDDPRDAASAKPPTRRSMPDETQVDLFEIIRTTRSMRRLKSDPVPDELIGKVLEAGLCAPSGGNMQRWRFLVIRDLQVKEAVGALYRRAWDETVAPRYRDGAPPPGTSRERFDRMLASAEHLAHHIHEAPVWIVPCLEGANPSRTAGSSIYPAIQNMLLAARALGLGATLTTLYLNFEMEAEAAFGLPPDWHSYAILPIGYPMGRFGLVRRVPLEQVVFTDRWGQAYRAS
jgi:nitroreductase